MEATLEPRAVGDIVGSFFVRDYQRGYRWGTEEVGRLLDDIWGSGTQPYYLQPVVVKAMGDGRWELIDGQQRFTTLYLIFQYMLDAGLKSAGANYTIEYETRTGSQEYLRNPNAEFRDANIDFHHIHGAYQHILNWFEAHKHRKQLAADRLYGALFETVKVIWYEAPPSLDSVALFTRLNVGRIPLSDAELTKALILAKSRELPELSDRSSQVAAQWDQFERDLRVPEVWSFLTGGHEEEATHIGLILDTLADRIGGKPPGTHRPRYHTFESLRPRIENNPQKFWDEVVALHSLVVGWYEDRDIFHKVGYLVALRKDTFADLVDLTEGLTTRQLHEALDQRIRERLNLAHPEVVELDYETKGPKCTEVLLLMNVETARRRKDSTERYSFHSHALGSWSLEHIHAQNAKKMKRDEKVWKEWLRLQRDAMAGVPTIDDAVRVDLLADIAEVMNLIDRQQSQGVGTRFDAVKSKVEAVLTEASAGSDGDNIANLALLASGDNSALSNSTFEVKRREILTRDKAGSYIPACTRNLFLKYYTDSDDQQIHFWGAADREAYLQAILAAVEPYLLSETDAS